MDPNSQEYMDLYAYVASLTPEVLGAMKKWEAERKALLKKLAGGGGKGNPCSSRRNPCNPCAGR
ncbi:MAG: hypothetical protein ACE5JJ_09195 [Nitrospinota bacterium]